MRKSIVVSALAVAFAAAAPAGAEVVASSPGGFAVRHQVVVAASPEDAWAEIGQPANWWNAEHSYSGDAANLKLDLAVGGCFCETLPAAEGAGPDSPPRGGAEHMRVIYVERPRALRLSGALGPLQSEALSGTLTITLKPMDAGTRILWEYVVGGYMRFKPEQIAASVDKVIGEQVASLGARLGARATPSGEAAAEVAAPIEGR